MELRGKQLTHPGTLPGRTPLKLSVFVMGCVFAIQQPREILYLVQGGKKSLFKLDMEKGNVEAEKATKGNGNDGLSTAPPPEWVR